MRLAILSSEPRNYSTRRLKDAALQRGHKVRVVDTKHFALDLESRRPDLHLRGKPVPRFDAILPRIGASLTYFGCAVVRQFEQMGVFTPNSAAAIAHSRDKLHSMQILARHDLGMPATAFVRQKSDVLPAIERVGGAPVIIKVLEGTQGVGVILAESVTVAQAIVETLQSARQNVLIQKFVAESRGRDVRAIVVGDRVVAAMRRVAQGQEFRSNVHRGGSTEVIELSPEFERTAVRAAQILGLGVAGVDMLESADGPQVMEVNSSPGLEGIEGATGLDLAGEVIEFIADQVDFPVVDVRQRLTVSRGYGVAELDVREDTDLVGKRLEETTLKDAGVAVLTVHRGGKVHPNPGPDFELERGDRLLCFGKLAAMRGMTVKPSRRRPRRKPRQLPRPPLQEESREDPYE